MPKTSLFADVYALKGLSSTVSAWQRHRNLTDEQVGRVLGCCARTWASRRAKPKGLTIVEFWQLARLLQIPREDAERCLFAGLETKKWEKKE